MAVALEVQDVSKPTAPDCTYTSSKRFLRNAARSILFMHACVLPLILLYLFTSCTLTLPLGWASMRPLLRHHARLETLSKEQVMQLRVVVAELAVRGAAAWICTLFTPTVLASWPTRRCRWLWATLKRARATACVSSCSTSAMRYVVFYFSSTHIHTRATYTHECSATLATTTTIMSKLQ